MQSNNVLQQPRYNTVSQTCRGPQISLTISPLLQHIFPSAPCSLFHNIVEDLKKTPTNISIWKLIQLSPTYKCLFQELLQIKQEEIQASMKLNNVTSSFYPTQVTQFEITFSKHEFPSLKTQNKNEALMIKAIINEIVVRHTLIDNGVEINVCSIDLLDKIGMDKRLI